MATAVRDRFDGEVPTELDDLVTLPGVGRKTGNVLRSVAFDLPGLPVDTHVGRLATRLRLTTETDPGQGRDSTSTPSIPPEERGGFSLRLILHGRRGVHRAPAPVRGLPPRRHLPVGGSAVSRRRSTRHLESGELDAVLRRARAGVRPGRDRPGALDRGGREVPGGRQHREVRRGEAPRGAPGPAGRSVPDGPIGADGRAGGRRREPGVPRPGHRRGSWWRRRSTGCATTTSR